jgi:hypothetical protein
VSDGWVWSSTSRCLCASRLAAAPWICAHNGEGALQHGRLTCRYSTSSQGWVSTVGVGQSASRLVTSIWQQLLVQPYLNLALLSLSVGRWPWNQQHVHHPQAGAGV